MATNDFNLLVAILGAATLLIGLGSKYLSASTLPPSLLALLLGIILGPELLVAIVRDEVAPPG